jgi:hypothetical protein
LLTGSTSDHLHPALPGLVIRHVGDEPPRGASFPRILDVDPVPVPKTRPRTAARQVPDSLGRSSAGACSGHTRFYLTEGQPPSHGPPTLPA